MKTVIDRPEISDLLHALEQAGQKFESIKGLARVTVERAGSSKSASQVVIAQGPDRLRLETLGLFGSPALLAATDGREMIVLLPGEGKAYTGSPGHGFLERVTGLPFSPGDIVAMLLLQPRLIAPESIGLETLDDGGNRLRLDAGRLGQEVDFDSERQLRRLALFRDGASISTIVYDRYQNGYPHHVEVVLAAGDLRVVLDFEDVAPNSTLAPTLFRLDPPAGYEVHEISESIQLMRTQ